MKLDKILNFKKVRCVKAYDDCLKIGKEYNVIDVSVEIKVKDDEGAFLYWESDHFEPVLDSAEKPLQGAELKPEFEAVSPHVSPPSNDGATYVSEPYNDVLFPRFEVGQKAYCPWLNDGELVTLGLDDNGDLIAQTKKGLQAFDCEGYALDCTPRQPDLFPATNYYFEHLSAIMPWIKFEQPPKPLTGIELAKKLIAKGHNYLVVDTVIGIRVLTRLEGNTLIDSNNVRLDELDDITPLDDETGEPLTEAVLGE